MGQLYSSAIVRQNHRHQGCGRAVALTGSDGRGPLRRASRGHPECCRRHYCNNIRTVEPDGCCALVSRVQRGRHDVATIDGSSGRKQAATQALLYQQCSASSAQLLANTAHTAASFKWRMYGICSLGLSCTQRPKGMVVAVKIEMGCLWRHQQERQPRSPGPIGMGWW